jgi:hypothetical protein
MIALVEPERSANVVRALKEAGATHTIVTQIS